MERPAKRARHSGPSPPPPPSNNGNPLYWKREPDVAPPRKFQDFAATHKGVVAEHVASLLATRDVARLMRTAPELRAAGELTFKLWGGSGERMAKAIAALEAKRKAARAEVKAKLDEAIAALGPKPNQYIEAMRAAWLRWGERVAPVNKAHDAELRTKLKAIDDAPRSPDLPSVLPAGVALCCLIPWVAAPLRLPSKIAACVVGEVHLPKQADAGGKSVRCWRRASWVSHGVALAASRATLDAADPRAAMEAGKRAMRAAWDRILPKLRRRRSSLAALRNGTVMVGFNGWHVRREVNAAQALLGTASLGGDVAEMQRAVAAGTDVRAAANNSMGHHGTCTAVHMARTGPGLRFLAGACGLDVNAVCNTSNGERPIHRACYQGTPSTERSTVLVLLALGADPTVVDTWGWTPCMRAARFSGSVPILRALVAGGPGGALVGDAVNAVNTHGKTALDYALEQDRAEFAAVLRDELGGKRKADLGGD